MGRHSITLDNFTDFHGVVNGVEILSTLPLEPYVPSDEIDINLGRIARAARIGHLNSLTFSRYSEQTSVTPGVDSLGEDGSATASFSANASTPPRADSSLDRGNPSLYKKGQGTIKINLGHEDLNEVNLREAKPWAQYLDIATSEGLRACSNRKLLSGKGYRALMMSLWTLQPVLDLANHNLSNVAADYGQQMLLYSAMIGLLSAIDGSSAEFSLTPGFSLDRIGAVQAYTRTHKFAKAK
jgi:hypothetical protein